MDPSLMIRRDIVFPDVPHDGVIGTVIHNTDGEQILREVTNTSWSYMWQMHCDEWTDAVNAYEANPFDFCNAWHYLDHHPAFWVFRYGPSDRNPLPLAKRLHVRYLETSYGIHRCVSIDVVKVAPDTRSINDDDTLNTRTEVWIELGRQSWPVEYDPADPNSGDSTFHDWRLDCGGSTVERAIIRAAYYVHAVYGNDRRVCDGVADDPVYAVIEAAEDELLDPFRDDAEINRRIQQRTARINAMLADAMSDRRD